MNFISGIIDPYLKKHHKTIILIKRRKKSQ